MNALNRLLMLIIALLVVTVPVLLLLVGFSVIPAEEIDEYTGYRNTLDALSVLSVSDITPRVRIVAGIIGALVALVALFLLMRELAFGRPVARKALVDDTPGRETTITAHAVRRLAEGAAREAGAVSPNCYLASKDRGYHVSCNLRVPDRSQNFAELAARAQKNIQDVLEEQRVPVKDVEVTVQGTTPQA
ncbi:MAG: hypothetical protein JOZ19_11095 [Rubrobacter sp.]|nr:hypothetical protein [Rubrobacter sp.]